MIILLFQTISRFGKRGDDESFVNLQNPSDNSRMGKRGDVTPSQADFLLLQDADEALSRLNRPRYVSFNLQLMSCVAHALICYYVEF